jgi:hypothetical protein
MIREAGILVGCEVQGTRTEVKNSAKNSQHGDYAAGRIENLLIPHSAQSRHAASRTSSTLRQRRVRDVEIAKA